MRAQELQEPDRPLSFALLPACLRSVVNFLGRDPRAWPGGASGDEEDQSNGVAGPDVGVISVSKLHSLMVEGFDVGPLCKPLPPKTPPLNPVKLSHGTGYVSVDKSWNTWVTDPKGALRRAKARKAVCARLSSGTRQKHPSSIFSPPLSP